MHIPINLRETDFKPWLIWGYSMKQTMCKSLPFEVCLYSHSFQSCVSQIKSGESYHIDDIHKINIFLATTHGKIKHPGWLWPYFLRKWTSSSKVVPKSRRNGFVPTPMAKRWLYPFNIYHETNLVNMKQTGKPLLVGGWRYPSEKYEFVNWDYYSRYMESQKIPWFHTTNQTMMLEKIP